MGSTLKQALALLVAATLLPAMPAAAQRVPTKAVQRIQAPEILADADGNKLFDNLEARLQGAPAAARIPVVVQFNGQVGQAEVARTLQAGKAAATPIPPRARWERALSGLAADLTPADIAAVARLPFVKQVELDGPVTAFLDGANQWTGADRARADFGVSGDRDGDPGRYTREDVVVAIIDTGIDTGHADLAGDKVIGWFDAVAGRAAPYDDNGHGTHVAGILAGTGAGDPRYQGVAPGAALVGVKVLNGQGGGTLSGILNGIEWLITNRQSYAVRVANMSLGAPGCSNGTDSLSTAVTRAVEAGITMVVAAGNSGPGACTIGAPAAAEAALTVGASQDPAEGGWALAQFSSRGPTQDRRTKPDVVAPGWRITAPRRGTANGYVAFSGTSMAAPFAAGVVALMMAANPNLSPAQVKLLIRQAAYDWGPDGKDNDWGWGLLGAYDAVKAAGAYAGRFSDGLNHRFGSGRLSATGVGQSWRFPVSSTEAPVAVTLVIPDWNLLFGPDFDLRLTGPDGTLVAEAVGTERQEMILIRPTATGTYTLEVTSYFGRGSYWFDVSSR